MKTAANAERGRAGISVREHDAGHDAAQALVGWWWGRQNTVPLTRKLAGAQDALVAAGPLMSVLGPGLRRRLSSASDTDLSALLKQLPAGVSPRKWFGTRETELGGTPLELTEKGNLEAGLELLTRNREAETQPSGGRESSR